MKATVYAEQQGQKRLLTKAREVFKILNKTLFKNRLTKRARQLIVK
jgi:hypothetical protein